jgi:Cu(I)/Ag(I) efflux system membrane fusion protein
MEETPLRRPSSLVWRLALVALGAGLGFGLAAVHFTGHLTPLYHRLGFHGLHQEQDHANGGSSAAAGGHAGHGMPGMNMQQGEPGQPSSLPGHAIVKIARERQQLIGVRTGKVQRDRLLMFVRAVGIVEPDQTRLARIQTRISGWVTKVHANFIGQNVKKGDPLLEIYSPDLVSTQEEYLIAVDGGQKPLADAARRRLELFGVSPDEIKELVKMKKARETLVLRSPINGRILERNALEGTRVEPTTELYRIADLSVVWVQGKVYEYELPHIEMGQPVHVTLLERPNTEFKGKVSFIEPVLQEATRTVRVRVALENSTDLFKPGMYANLVIDHDMGEGLLVPEEGILRTGERALAFRVLPENRFEPVQVKLGSRFGERVEVLAGLSEGDEIVTSAVFLIDAESRLKSATSAFGGHQHGGVPQAPPKSTPSPKKPSVAHDHKEHDHKTMDKKAMDKKAAPGHEHHHH